MYAVTRLELDRVPAPAFHQRDVEALALGRIAQRQAQRHRWGDNLSAALLCHLLSRLGDANHVAREQLAPALGGSRVQARKQC
jgi:hypothetical protein